MDTPFPFPGLVDLRQPILGDSYNWDGTEPLAAKKSVVFHHSGEDAPAEDAFSIADYHVNHNGWGGIGYHFVITRKDYPGRSPFTQPGAQVQYVGDLGTWRAHVANQNPGRIGVCLVGLEPDEEQLKLARQLMDFMVAPNEILPSLNYGSQATVHQLVPEQQTSCPGTTFPQWLPYVQGGAFPDSLFPQPTPPPVAVPDEGGRGSGEQPVPVIVVPKEWEATYQPQTETKPILRPGAFAADVTTGRRVVENIPVGQQVQIAGYFQANSQRYARSVYAASQGIWNGVPAIFFDEPTGQPSGTVPVIVVPKTEAPADVPVTPVTDQDFHDAMVPETPKLTFWEILNEWWSHWAAAIIRRVVKK